MSLEKNQLKLQMTRQGELLWEIQAGLKKSLDHKKELTFKLYHMPSVSTIPAEEIWRVIQFEGAFVLPSNKARLFNPPAPMSGKQKLFTTIISYYVQLKKIRLIATRGSVLGP